MITMLYLALAGFGIALSASVFHSYSEWRETRELRRLLDEWERKDP